MIKKNMNSQDEARKNLYKDIFEKLYSHYTLKEYISPDPLQFLYDYKDTGDREIVGFIASSLALGNVQQIIKSVSRVLEKMPSPLSYLKKASLNSLKKDFKVFKHRFITGDDLAYMLFGLKDVISRFGSLKVCFSSGFKDNDSTVIPALTLFVNEANAANKGRKNRLLPSPEGKSACKRLNLFLRWMVRQDTVDPGGWDNIPTSKLILPLDTHIHKIGLTFGFTERKQKDMKTAIEITDAFRKFAPDDPVKYDFALTRLGIREKENMAKVYERLVSNGVLSEDDNSSTLSILNNDMHVLM